MAVTEGGGATGGRPGNKARRQTDPRDDLRRELTEGGDDSENTLEEEFDPGFFWQDAVVDRILADIKDTASAYDIDLDFVTGWFNGQQLNMINYLQRNILGPGGGMGGLGLTPEWYTNTPEGIANLFTHARNWVAQRFPAFGDLMSGTPPGSGGRGRSGGGGPKRPTAAEIRAQFDVDQLTGVVNDLWRQKLLQTSPEAKQIAEAYVESIVANPEQELDFETFVVNRIKNTSRYQVIYEDKPDSMTDEQYLQPMFQVVQQTLGSGEGSQVADITVNQTRLGASPAALQQRLQRERQVQVSSPFMQKMGERLSGFKDVLR